MDVLIVRDTTFLVLGELGVSGLVNCSYMKLVLTVDVELGLGLRLEW